MSVGPTARADNPVEKRIETRLEKDKQLKEHKINVDVDDQGIATLKGSVSTGGEKARAEQLAHVKGVSRIENDISVAVPDRDLGNEIKREVAQAGEAVTDSWITAKVKTQFVSEDALDGSDINVDTDNDVVTLRGTVPSESARQRAMEIARSTKGVQRVDDKLSVARKR
jgi:osmotically-inducible protein OsmY